MAQLAQLSTEELWKLERLLIWFDDIIAMRQMDSPPSFLLFIYFFVVRERLGEHLIERESVAAIQNCSNFHFFHESPDPLSL